MKINRRTFCTLAGVAGAMAAMPRATEAVSLTEWTPTAKLRLSCQEGVAPGKELAEKLDILESLGFEGFEPGGGGLSKRVEELQAALKGRKIKISAICAGFQGVPISEKEEERTKAIESSKEILTAAGALGSTGMILVPAFNGQTTMPDKDARELLVTKILPEIGDHAAKAGTRLLLEPLNRRECYFLRQVADGASICRDVNNRGIALMGDFWHMTWEETSDMGAFISGGKYLHHVHMASRKTRNMPGEDDGDDYTIGFRGLKTIGYQDFVSFECGYKNQDGDHKKILARAVNLLKENWEAA